MNILLGKQAVVIGAGMAGLAMAKSLSTHFESVVIIERDRVLGNGTRPGVPQGKHPHILLAGGLRALISLYPGIDKQLIAAGAVPLRAGVDIQVEMPGIGIFPKRDFGITSLSLSRPLLEGVVRDITVAVKNVVLRSCCTATKMFVRNDGSLVTAIEVRNRGGALEVIPADLVVDASGRGASLLAHLQASGRGFPCVSLSQSEITYSSGTFSPEEVIPEFLAAVTLSVPPASTRSAYAMKIENDRWQILLSGRGADRPPGDIDGLRSYADEIPQSAVARLLRTARLEDGLSRYSFPETRWYRYSEFANLPRRAMPVGDAICRLNPVYGQGMSLALQQAELWSRLSRSIDDLDKLVHEFLQVAARGLEIPWQMCADWDSAFEDSKFAKNGLVARKASFEQIKEDPEAHRAFLEAQHLLL